MGNVISWADAVEALKVIAEEQEAVSGMSVAEAATALKYTKSASGMYLKTVMSTAVESIAGTTAAEVATTTATEAATTTAVNLSLVEGATTGTAEVVGIGSIALPIAACVAAAGGGYLIGKELNKNEAYSDFFDRLVYTVGDFVTGNHLADTLDEDDTLTVPLLYDANGKAYLPSDLVSGVKTFLDSSSNALLSSANSLVKNLVNRPYAYILGPYGDPALVYYLTASETPFTLTYNGTQYILNNSTGYGYKWQSLNGGLTWTAGTPFGNSEIAVGSSTNMATRIPYSEGNITSGGITVVASNWNPADNQGSLPTPITKYTPSTTLPAITKTDGNGDSWSRIFLPSTSPLEMPDGEPVPETEPEPSRLTPYITPVQPQPAEVPIVVPDNTPATPLVLPNPEPDTSTAPYPAPDPAVDPSQLADPLPSTEPAEPLPDPVDTGTPVIPVLPSVTAPSSAKGLLHVYNPTQAQVDSFGEWLWTTFSGDLIDTIGKLFNNPMDAVIGLHELYCTPDTTETTVNIRAGFLDSNVASRLVNHRYKELKCGALSVPEYWGNYLDYAPYTKSYCYLPFIGIVELNTDDVVGSGVEIMYRIDTFNGSCIAMITTAKPNSDESVTYQFEGNCSVSVPITSGMMTTLQNGLIGIATTALSAGATAAITAATGGAAIPAAALVGSVAAGASNHALASKNMVQHSGSFGSSYGAMGIKIPFLIIKRPRQKVVYGYNDNYGYPAHKMVLLSTCSGYLRAKEVEVISSTATETEKKMIEECLKSGVFID